MKFGKVDQQGQLESQSMELTPRVGFRPLNSPPEKAQIYIGAPVWGKKEWVGHLYPPKTPQRDFLKFYALQMNSIELNMSYYRLLPLEMVESWRKVVPREFRFCPKVFQGISYFSRLQEVPDMTRRFCESAFAFGENLGLCFLQLPAYFGPERLLILQRFSKLLPSQLPLAFEFRHPGWFQKNQLIEPAFQLLSEHGFAPVITDALGRADVLHGSLTSRRVMVRFLGNSLHPSDYRRLQEWVVRIESWIDLGVREIYFFIHQPEENGVIELVQWMVEEINQRYPNKLGIQLQGIDLSRAIPQGELALK